MACKKHFRDGATARQFRATNALSIHFPSDEQAFDAAAYVDSPPRPVKKRLEADFPARKNKPVDAAFPPYPPGSSAEQHKYGPWQPIQAAREKGGYLPK